MPLSSRNLTTWPNGCPGSKIVEIFTQLGMNKREFCGSVYLTWPADKVPKEIHPSSAFAVRTRTKYPKARVRRLMERAGITPEKWREVENG